ncbi:ferredoxin [Microbacterium sp. RD1]|uniref:ferredoxin n=1 Tax=Microbacterium sp. RD1 TaxID=3457313 RepID=UPI003FA57166
MRVEVDYDVCAGLGVCESLAPRVFRVGADSTMTIVSPELEDTDIAAVEEAVAACPTFALRIAR